MKRLFLGMFMVLSFSLAASNEATQLTSAGNSFANRGKYPEALEQLTKAIEKDPAQARAYKLRGHVYYAMGDYQKAFADLDKVVELAPNNYNVYVDRAIVNYQAGNKEAAKRDIAKALKMNPDSAFSKAAAEKILSQ